VPAVWVETQDGNRIGKTFTVAFVHGKACPDDALTEYLIKYGHAQREPWHPPASSTMEDPAWRWRETSTRFLT
jgi:hypothetical protein